VLLIPRPNGVTRWELNHGFSYCLRGKSNLTTIVVCSYKIGPLRRYHTEQK